MDIEGAKTVITLLSAVIIPVLLAYLGSRFTNVQKERDIQAQFVKIAVDILQAPPTRENKNVREWATQIINQYSGVPLSSEARRDLIENVQISALEFGLKYAAKAPSATVDKVQDALRQLGYLTGPATGSADQAMVEALIAFQREHGMVADGALGPQTEAAIFAALAAQQQAGSEARGR